MGVFGQHFAEALEYWRNKRRFTYSDLSDTLSDLGHPLAGFTLSRLEKGERRADVDDLVYLALVLGVSPLNLLAPPPEKKKKKKKKIPDFPEVDSQAESELLFSMTLPGEPLTQADIKKAVSEALKPKEVRTRTQIEAYLKETLQPKEVRTRPQIEVYLKERGMDINDPDPYKAARALGMLNKLLNSLLDGGGL